MVSAEEVADIGHTIVATDIGGTDTTIVLGALIIAICAIGAGKSSSQTEVQSPKRLKST